MNLSPTAATIRLRRWRRMAPALALAAVLAGCTLADGGNEGTPGATPSAGTAAPREGRESPSAGDGTDRPGEDNAEEAGAMAIPDIVDAVQPSVVTIFTEGGLGSGVIYSEDGLIITNEHVVRNNTEVEVAFADGQRVAGTVTAADRVSDLALVQAEREDLPAAQFQDRLPEIGELAVVIGSPLGFENTVT